MSRNENDRTISDFGDQWTRYVQNEGYYGSTELFKDIVGPRIEPDMFANKCILDIGSGTGRIVEMLLESGAAKVIAVEPSRAFETLQANVSHHGDRVVCLNARGDQISFDLAPDHAVSIGVLHHIRNPHPVVSTIFATLKPGGRFIAWLYGREGNETYLAFILPLRAVTKRLPHPLLAALCHSLNMLLSLYTPLAIRFRLPLHTYLSKVIAHLDKKARYLVIYDQLNPSYAKYYNREEAETLLIAAGFIDVSTHHRHGYSWTVIGTKPAD